MSEQLVEVYPYRFKVVTLDYPPGRVYVAAYRADTKDISSEDRPALNAIFGDMGKWEALTGAGIILLAEVGAINPPPTPVPRYSPSKYTLTQDTQVGRFESRIGYFVGLSSDERNYREASNPQGGSTSLTVEEIASQLRNVPKWQSLGKVIGLIAPIWDKQKS